MEWSKIKNIILAILLCVNLILLSVVGYREYQSAAYARQAVTSALKLLSDNGITVTAALPDAPALSTLQVDGAGQDPEEERQRVASLLGEIGREEPSAGGMRTRYEGANGTAELTSAGRFEFTLREGCISLTAGTASQRGKELLAGLGVEGVLWETQEDDDGLVVRCYQAWNGVPVFTSETVLTGRDGWLLKVKGQRISGAAATLSTEEPLTVPTVLTRFLAGIIESRLVCSEVTRIAPGYEATASPPFRLTPTWDIVTDTGEYRYTPSAPEPFRQVTRTAPE